MLQGKWTGIYTYEGSEETGTWHNTSVRRRLGEGEKKRKEIFQRPTYYCESKDTQA